VQSIFWVIIFDIANKMDVHNSRYKRISKTEYEMFIDEVNTQIEAEENFYHIISRRYFMIHTTLDCSHFVILDCEKIIH